MYTDEELLELSRAIEASKISTDDRLVRMAKYLEEAISKVKKSSTPGLATLYKVIEGCNKKKHYYEDEKIFLRWFKYHKEWSIKLNNRWPARGYEFKDGKWVEVVLDI